MPKLIQIKIVKIKYSGDSIGDDIKMEVDCLGALVDFKKRLKCNSEVSPKLFVNSFISDNKIFNLPIGIKIIEEDLVFNDVGVKLLNLKIDLKTSGAITEVCKIEVIELRNFIAKNKAVFEVFIEISVKEVELYVDEDKGGWLDALPENSNDRITLPKYLKVQLEKTDNERQYFKILEGVRRGESASIKFKEGEQSYLGINNRHTKPVQLVYSISKKTLKLGNAVYKATDDPDNLWKKGDYDIEIPDTAHRGGRYYPDANLSKVWFRIGHEGTRYLHIGAHSLGCITLTEVSRWDELCDTLLRARKGDNLSVGVVKVID